MGDVISDNGKRGSSRRSVKAALLGTAAIYLVAGLAGDIVDTAHAQVASQNAAVTTNTFNIRPQELGSALTAFADSAELRLLFPSSLVAGKRSPGISGNLTREQALSRLLAGTGLTWRFTAANTVTIVDPAASNEAGNINADGSLVLDTITVQGQAINNWDAPPEYPGGQVARGGQLGILGNVDFMDAPFSQTSYTEKYIKDQQATNLAEALQGDPSVRLDSGTTSIGDTFNIRGFGAGAMAYQDKTLNGLAGVGTTWRLPVELYERVEVLKGPNAFLSGTTERAGSGGSINLVTKRATDDPINAVTVGYMSNETVGTHVDFGRRWGDNKEFGIRANGVFRGGEINRDLVDRRTGAGSIAFDYRGERLRTSLDFVYSDQTVIGANPMVVLRSGVAVPRAPRAGRNYLPNDTKTSIREYSIVGSAEYDLTPDWTIFSKVGYHKGDSEIHSAATGLVDSYGNSTPLFPHRGIRDEDISFQGGMRGKFSTGPLDHSVTLFGAQHNRETGDLMYGIRFGALNNLYNPNFYSPSKFPKSAIPTTSKYQFQSAGLSDTISAFDDRVQLTVGMRYISIMNDSFSSTNGSRTSGFDVSALTPIVGLVIKPADNVSVYASYIEGLSPGYVVTDSSASNFGAVFNPVKTKQYEAGVKWDLGRITATAALFQIEEPAIGFDGSSYSQNGLKRVRGLELNAFGEIRSDLRILGGITLMDGESLETAGGTNNGKVAPAVPRLQGNLGLEWDTPWLDGLTLTGRAVYTGSQYVSYDNVQKIPSWTRFDVGARYATKINNYDLTFRASVENVFNKSYWESTYYGSLVGNAAPRTYRLSATVKF